MKKEKLQRLHVIYSVITGISAVAAGICLIAACLGIYCGGGDAPYSRQIVAEAFRPIAIPVYACTVLVLGGFILDLALPSSPRKEKPGKNFGHILQQLQSKADYSQCSDELRKQIEKQRKIRRVHMWISTVLITVCSAVFLAFALDGSHFHQTQINASMIRAMWVLIPCFAVSFGYAVFVSYLNASCIQKEIALLRQLPAAKGHPEAAGQKSGKAIGTIRVTFLVLGAALLVYGFCTGGTMDVLTKAVNICTECIGLG